MTTDSMCSVLKLPNYKITQLPNVAEAITRSPALLRASVSPW
jgi:hypothetical protein